MTTMSTPFDLSGKTAVVTGGGRGLGLGISDALLEAGADVIVFGRSPLPVALTKHAAELGRQVDFVAVDLANSDTIAAAADQVLSARRVDILVNNAGTQDRYPAVNFPLAAWDSVLDVNLRAVFQLCQQFGRPMLERGEGKIVNLASLLSFQGGTTVPAYAASKGAVAQLTKALCNEWSSRGVNVNAVAPGYMATEMNTACWPTRSAWSRSRRGSRQVAGESRRTSATSWCSLPLRLRHTFTARSSPSTGAGWPDDRRAGP